MAKQRFLDAINLRPTDRVAQSEWLNHPEFIKKLTGTDPFEDPAGAIEKAIRKLDLDWYVDLPRHSEKFDDGAVSKNLGNGNYVSQWGFTGSGWHRGHEFADEEEVLAYDPLARTTPESRLAGYKRVIEHMNSDQKIMGDACYISGLYYTTLFQWFILTFGWEMFLITAAAEPKRFERSIEQFAKCSIEYAEYFATTDLPIFYCHDDLAITRGLVFPYEWYKKYIFPNYERIFDPIKKAGKKIMFVSDGNYTSIIDDLVAVGIDALFCDEHVDIELLLKKYGGRKAVIGNASVDILTRGSTEDVKNEVIRCMNYGKRYPGYVMRVSGDMPENIPLQNLEAYFEYCREYGRL